jgi:hypothetical protein
VHVETALPKFFATVTSQPTAPNGDGGPPPARARRPARRQPEVAVDEAFAALETTVASPIAPPARPKAGQRERKLARDLGLDSAVRGLAQKQGRSRFETRTGFTVFGAKRVEAYANGWRTDIFRDGSRTQLHIRLWPETGGEGGNWGSTVIEFDGASGTVMPVLPGFIGTLVVDKKRTVSVNYVPSENSGSRYVQYQKRAPLLERMKAFAAVSSRHGRLAFDDTNANELARLARQGKGIDPTLGVYAAYAYAHAGRHDQAYDVYRHMRNDEPVPFDVVMLAARHDPDVLGSNAPAVAPFVPMLGQGWALLARDDPLHSPRHEDLRACLIPSLWTTFDRRGVEIARGLLGGGAVR